MNYRIAIASVKDINDLNDISYKAKSHWGYPAEWIDAWRDKLLLRENDFTDQQIFKLIIENEIVGFCAISEDEDKYEVEHLWILPGQMGKGHGRKLLEKCLEISVLQPKPIKVIADPNAEDFYKKLGFETIDIVESYPRGRFIPVMEKEGI